MLRNVRSPRRLLWQRYFDVAEAAGRACRAPLFDAYPLPLIIDRNEGDEACHWYELIVFRCVRAFGGIDEPATFAPDELDYEDYFPFVASVQLVSGEARIAPKIKRS